MVIETGPIYSRFGIREALTQPVNGLVLYQVVDSETDEVVFQELALTHAAALSACVNFRQGLEAGLELAAKEAGE